MSEMSLNELLAQKAAIEKQIAETMRAERSNALAQIHALMAQYGLTVADLSGKAASTPRRGPAAGAAPGSSKVAAKYRDPATGSTWSGRGLKPRWLKAALESGRSLSDFAISA